MPTYSPAPFGALELHEVIDGNAGRTANPPGSPGCLARQHRLGHGFHRSRQYQHAGWQGRWAKGEYFDWYYASDTDRDAQMRTTISDGAYGKPWVFRQKDIRNWWANPHYDRPSGTENPTPTAWVPQSKPIRFTEFGCPAIDRGSNQPNVFVDPKSSESAVPHYSRGWRDDAIQRSYLEATLGFWGNAANNPTSGVYGAPMIDLAEAAAWTWDARPYPDFPARTDIWADAPNWQLGHWLNGRLGAAGLGALVRALCRRAGLDDALIDISDLVGAAPGFVVSALESPRASISVLARHFGFDATETGGLIKFVPRGRAAVATLTPDEMVAGKSGSGEVMELVRGQETELPQALKWQVVRPDEEYDTATVEARRVTVTAARVASETFPLAVPLEDADRRARRALMEAWIGRETLTASLPPSKLALDTGDVVSLAHDGRLVEYRLARIADAQARAIEATRVDATMYDLPPGQERGASLPGATVYGPANVVLMDLPQLDDTTPAHRPWAAVFAKPWYGAAAIWRSAATSGFTLLDTVPRPADMGTLVADLPAGPVGRFDLANTATIDLTSGALASVSDLDLFAGANTLAIETAPGQWEILQVGTATLVATGRYDLTRLLRGQRGTEDRIGSTTPAGARVVLLDTALQPLSISEADIGIDWNWRIGPSNAQPSDTVMQALAFTPNGRGLVPFSPVQARLRRKANGDLSLRWLRRDRALSADSWVLTGVPISEASESYDLEILNAGVVVRTVSHLTTPGFTWTTAMQTADVGGPVTSVDVRITQIGALGRGVPLATTLTVTESP
jgi:GTA TIM-barrel-like domain/Putative phage tail protein